MRYLVMKCGFSYAVVLDQQGRFLKVANLGYAVGQTVDSVIPFQEEQKKSRTSRRVIPVLAAAACLCLVFLGGFQYILSPYGTVRIQINPDVMISVNRWDYAVDVEGMNDDGEELVEDYHYIGKKVDQVSDELADRAVDASPELYETRVGSDFLAEGEMATAWLEEKFAGRSQVSVIHIQGTPGSTAQVGRTAALEAALDRNWNWTLLAQMDGDFTQAKSYEVMTNFLAENHSPPIDLVYCENDNEAFGTIQALEEYGYVCGAGGVTVVCFDATRNGLRWCMDGRISLVVECDPLLGPLTAQVIEKLEAGEALKTEYSTAQRCFTPQDLSEDFIAQRPY